MKITQDSAPSFRPVTIVLESQDEVDRLYALVNHSALFKVSGLSSLYTGLFDYYSSAAGGHFKRVRDLLDPEGDMGSVRRAERIGDGRF